jgi:uncharacterized protein YqgC (DUF456 family)
MSLKTAALIALIGIVIHLFLGLFMMMAGFLGFRLGLGIYLTQIFWVFNTLIFNGCLILFLAVFYAKQQS